MLLESHLGLNMQKWQLSQMPTAWIDGWHEQKVLTYFNHNATLFRKWIASASRAILFKQEKGKNVFFGIHRRKISLGKKKKKHPSASLPCQRFFLLLWYVTAFLWWWIRQLQKHTWISELFSSIACATLGGRAAGSEHTFLPITCIHDETSFQWMENMFFAIKKRRKYLTVIVKHI